MHSNIAKGTLYSEYINFILISKKLVLLAIIIILLTNIMEYINEISKLAKKGNPKIIPSNTISIN